MGYKEEMMNDREVEQTPKKGKKGEVVEERLLAGSDNYDYYNMGKLKPMKGSNSW